MRAVSVFAGGDTSFWVSNDDGRGGVGGGRGIGVASARIELPSIFGTDCVTRTETGGVVAGVPRAASSCL
jgi:hypothetical protein